MFIANIICVNRWFLWSHNKHLCWRSGVCGWFMGAHCTTPLWRHHWGGGRSLRLVSASPCHAAASSATCPLVLHSPNQSRRQGEWWPGRAGLHYLCHDSWQGWQIPAAAIPPSPTQGPGACGEMLRALERGSESSDAKFSGPGEPEEPVAILVYPKLFVCLPADHSVVATSLSLLGEEVKALITAWIKDDEVR